MDVWIVAAAAGAGYVVQNLKNLTRGKNKYVDLSSESLNVVRTESTVIRPEVGNKSCKLSIVLSRKSFGEEISWERKKVSDSESASTTWYVNDNPIMLDNVASYSTVSESNSLAVFLENRDVRGDWDDRLPTDGNEVFTSDSLPRPSTSEVGFCYSYEKKRSNLKSRRISSQSIKPQTSLESCLMAQLYEEHAEIEECTYSLHPLQKPTVRPFLVTDGSRIISRVPYVCFSEGEATTGIGTGECLMWKDANPHENKTLCGVPRLPNLVPVDLRKNAKPRSKEEQVSRRTNSSKIEHRNHNNARGTPSRALLFYLGLTMGIVSSFLANKQEMEKLKTRLNQSENLVQDLQEELEMKDSLTVKELATEDYESHDVHNNPGFDGAIHALSVEKNFEEEYYDQTAEKKSLSNIEAELEAELERLESSMNSSSLEGKLCNLTQLDPDLASDAHEGKLKTNFFGAHRDRSGSSTPHSAHYAVSPRELSLRLHQLIQSRLEERVKELESALQRKLKLSKRNIHPWRDPPSNYKTATCSTADSPNGRDGQDSLDQPVIINLSGEAIAAYDEAYEEFTREDLEIGIENGNLDRDLGANKNQETVFEDLYSVSNGNEYSSGEEAEDGEDDDMERLLIRQIVEKAKQGSPAVLKAQRAFLFSTDENEH